MNANTTMTNAGVADEAEYKRVNALVDGLSLYFEEHHKELLSLCGVKSAGIKLV
jgi:hypothetical protein